jgi:uncharacterized protein (TIGR03032 family)
MFIHRTADHYRQTVMEGDPMSVITIEDPKVNADAGSAVAERNGAPTREIGHEYTPSLPTLLSQLGVSLLVSTYQAGKVVAVGVAQGELSLSYHNFERAMGMAVKRDGIAVAARAQVWLLQGAPDLAARVEPAGRHDACFLTRSAYFTGEIQAHELAFSGDELWLVNTAFGCLCTLDGRHSFVPRWRPPFLTALTPDDRCHLNGLALESGVPKYVTALAETDTPQGWRADKARSGCLIDVPSGQTVARGFAMPHSPRVHGGRGLDAPLRGRANSCWSIRRTARRRRWPSCPATRAAWPFMTVSRSSACRRSARPRRLGGMPIAERRGELKCGVGVIDLITGRLTAHLEFMTGVEEIFDIQVVPGTRCPALSGPYPSLDGAAPIWTVPQPPPASGQNVKTLSRRGRTVRPACNRSETSRPTKNKHLMKPSLWHRWWQSVRGAHSAARVSRRGPRRSHLCVETLEDRLTLSATPQMVLDINTNTWSSNPSQLTAVGSLSYFVADDGIHGQELWKSDGTEAGTVLVKDINPGSAGAFYHNGYYQKDWLTNVNGTLFFVANDGTHGFKLWKSDGTEAGTVLVNSLAGGPSNLTNVNGTLFFSAHTSATGYELWKSDGAEAGTTLVKDIKADWESSHPSNLTNVNGTLFFSVYDYFGAYSELWKSDGTADGTVLVKAFDPHNNSNSFPRDLTNVNGTLFFSAYVGTHGVELWKSDGTAAGTVLVKDINPGSTGFYPSSLTNVNGTLFFSTVTGQGLWKSDGTAAGTTLVKDIYYPKSLTNVNGTLFFSARNFDISTGGEALWKSDGTEAGTVVVKDIYPGDTWSGLYGLTSVNGTLFFTANDGVTGYELWKSDGAEGGTVLVTDIYAGSATSYPGSLTNVNGTLMFAANDGRHGVELWKSDGTAAGTTLVKDINTRTFSSYPTNFTDVNGTLFFSANDGVHGYELWKSDGTVAGTTLVKDIYPGSGWTGNSYGYYQTTNSSFPTHLTNVNGTLFFTANDGVGGWNLWKSDGTEAGTVLVSRSPWYPNNLTVVNETLFFTADDGTNGRELWKSDGTAAGTTLVKDIYPGTHREYGYYGGYWDVPNSSYASNLTNVNGTLFFTADDGANGRELWQSDGTAAGTVLFKDINSGSASANPFALMNVDGTLFFSANDGTNGHELWKSDGTAAGTVLLKDISPGAYGSYPSSLTKRQRHAVLLGQQRHERNRVVEERRHRRGAQFWSRTSNPGSGRLLAQIPDERQRHGVLQGLRRHERVRAMEERRRRGRHRTRQGHPFRQRQLVPRQT